MAFLVPALAIAGTAMSAVGSLTQSSAQAGASRYNAGIANENAVIAEQQGNAAAEAQDRDARRKIGAAVASYGASGVDGGSGSAAEVLMDSARMAALDHLTVKYNYQLRANSYRNQASLAETNADNAETSGVFNALGGIGKGLGSAIPMFGK